MLFKVKMISVRIFCLVLTVSLLVTPAFAEYTLYGLGGLQCEDWVKKRTNDTWYDIGEWMLGFISAVGYFGVYDLKEDDAQAFAEWMDRYCQQNPLDEFADGVHKLVEELNINSKP